MSYDIHLEDPATGNTVQFQGRHDLRGGTCCLGGTNEAWINITWNYSAHFAEVLGDKGIRSIYGMTAEKSVPVLEAAAEKLAGNVDKNYWKATPGNARAALLDLVALARMAPPGSVWGGD